MEVPFQRFTERARKVLVLAQEEAEAAGSGYLGTEHLLFALLEEGEGLGAVALANLGVRSDRVREMVRSALAGRPAAEPPTTLRPTDRVKRVIEIAFEEARRMGHDYVGTEHLALGLLIEGESIAARVLQDLGATPDGARAEIERLRKKAPRAPFQLLRPGGPSPSPELAEVVSRAQALARESGSARVELEHLERALMEWHARGR
ncbi:MAG TPA: Clp protease N-terminal domain-containing protein [Candidatus Dormibacteraeota bacterium]|nr:Clp protease N-terminal domain-containing protein [Candidatus Dormibacteraeota bacterium]